MFGALSYPPVPLVEVGPLTLSLHGLFAGIGFVAGAWLMLREVKRRGFDSDKVISVLTWALIGAILGARFFTVPAHLGEDSLSEIFSISGDYSILGGYAGGIIAGVIRGKMLGMALWPHFDMAAPGLALGAVVGRIGDLAIVEHLGSPTTFFLGYQLKPGYDISPQHDILEQICEADVFCGPYHHTGLYDLLGALALLGVLLLLRRRWTTAHYGQLFAVWAIWYGLQRFLIDFARLGAARDGLTLPNGEVVEGVIADGVMGPLTGSQWGALLVAVIGVGLFMWFRARTPLVSVEQDFAYGAQPPGFVDPDTAVGPAEAAPSDDGAPTGTGAQTTTEDDDAAVAGKADAPDRGGSEPVEPEGQ